MLGCGRSPRLLCLGMSVEENKNIACADMRWSGCFGRWNIMNDAGVRPFSIRALLKIAPAIWWPCTSAHAWGEGERESPAVQDLCWISAKIGQWEGAATYTISAPWWVFFFARDDGSFRGNRWPAALLHSLCWPIGSTSRDRFGGYWAGYQTINLAFERFARYRAIPSSAYGQVLPLRFAGEYLSMKGLSINGWAWLQKWRILVGRG